MKNSASESEIRKALTAKNRLFERLHTTAFGIVTNTLDEENIDFLPVQSRVKTLDSLIDKVKRKSYSSPLTDCTDIVALRVIVFLERDIKRAAAAMRKVFDIDESKSIDKTVPEKAATVGYRSLHLICSLVFPA